MDTIIRNMVFTAAHYRNITIEKIARVLGTSRFGLYRKIERASLKPRDLEKIGKALGGEFVCYFLFPDGSKIGRLDKPVKGPVANKINSPAEKKKFKSNIA